MLKSQVPTLIMDLDSRSHATPDISSCGCIPLPSTLPVGLSDHLEFWCITNAPGWKGERLSSLVGDNPTSGEGDAERVDARGV